MSPLREALAAAAVVGIALAAAGYVAAPAVLASGFPLDDAWITQVMAKNLVATGVWGFEPGHASSGATSILWTLVTAVPHLLGRPAPATWSVLVCAALLAAFCGVLYRMRREDGDGPLVAASLAALPALLGNAAWLTATGLEPLLVAFLSGLAVLLWRRDSPWTGVACALAALARPEGVGVGLTLATLDLFDRDRRRPAALARLLGPVVVAAAATVTLSWTTSGGWLPTTFEGRRWLFRVEEPFSLAGASAFARAWASQLVDRALGAPRWLAPVALGAAVIGLLSPILGLRPGRRPSAFAGLVACAVATNVAYLVLLPNIGHGGRYQPLNLLLFPPLVALGIAAVARKLAPRRVDGGRIRVAVAAAVALACLPSLSHWHATTRDGVAHIEGAHRALATWVASGVEPGSAVAAFDIGALAYAGAHPVVDLGGLVNRDYITYLRAGRVPDYLRERGVRWVALPLDAPDGVPGLGIGHRLGLLGGPGVALEPVVGFTTPREVWAPAFIDTGHALPRLELFRIVPDASSNPSRVSRDPPAGGFEPSLPG